MKTIFITFLLSILIMKSVISQNNNLVVYSQDGFKFTIILNGIRQNAEPQTNVKVTGLNATNYQVKIIFANNMPDMDQNTYLMYGGEETKNTEYSYSISKVKDKYKLKFKSAAPFEGSSIAADPQQTIVVYTPVNAVSVNSTTVTTTNTAGTTTDDNVNVNVNAMGVGMNVNINTTDMGTGTNVTSSQTTTTYSTTTSTSGVGTNSNSNTTYVLQGYNGVYGCPFPMSSSDFDATKQSIASKGFDESRLTIAKQIIGSNCLLCSQIKELMSIMSFEETKLDLAKFAWHHNLDRGNYYKLNDAFSFEASIEELNKYTQEH